MEITLEKIELVKDRTGVTYKEAKEALEQADGNVVEAIISLEEKIDETSSSQKISDRGEKLIARMKEVIRRGNIARIVIKRGDEIILNIPLNIGVIGVIVAPWGIVIGVLAAFGFKCQVELVKDNGDIVDITDKAGNLYDEAVIRGSEFYDEIREKAPAVYETVKEKGGDAVSRAVEVAKTGADKIRSKSENAAEDAADAEGEVQEVVQEKSKGMAPDVEYGTEEVEDTVADAKEEVKDTASDVKDKAEDVAGAIEDEAEKAASDAEEKAKSEEQIKRFKFF